MAKDAVIGFITGYNFDKIKPWVYSLIESGFAGDKYVVMYESNMSVITKLKDLGFKVVVLNKDEPFNIVVHRFYHLWWMLNVIEEKYRYVVTTDVADVIFQTNPSTFLPMLRESYCGILASEEGLKYRDEPWGDQNLKLSFGENIHHTLKDKVICNAGVLAGRHEEMESLALNVYLACKGSPLHVPGGGGPDQAALNVILNMEPWAEVTWRTNHKDGWACQCGTVADPNKINDFRPLLTDCEPVWDGEYAYTPEGRLYTIVHQYNRVPAWKEVIEKRYE